MSFGPGILILLFFIPMLFGVPIGYALGICVLIVCLGSQFLTPDMLAQTFFTANDSFPFLAIPFFILAGDIMLKGGLSTRIVGLAKAFVGNITGALGIITVFACMIFAAISGSGPATVAAIGGLMIPEMVKDGYDKSYACALSATAGAMGPIIPPSIMFIIFGVMAGVSVTDLFMAGILPGITMALCLAAFVFITAKRNGFGTKNKNITWRERGHLFIQSIWALFVPIIILGGIYSGLVTPTEAGVLACVYALFVALVIYRDLRIRDLPDIFRSSCRTTGYCMVFVGAASVLGKILTLQHIPQQLAELVYGISTNPIVILLILNVVFLFIGCFMDPTSAIIIFGPIVVPIVTGLGINLIHFGVIMVMNVVIGMTTPPVGINMFVASGVGKIKPETMFKWLYPMIAMLVLALMVTTYVPGLSLAFIKG